MQLRAVQGMVEVFKGVQYNIRTLYTTCNIREKPGSLGKGRRRRRRRRRGRMRRRRRRRGRRGRRRRGRRRGGAEEEGEEEDAGTYTLHVTV